MEKLWEFKVEYKRSNEVSTREHYFNAETYEQAEAFHNNSMARHKSDKVSYSLICISRKCPYSNKWLTKEEDSFLNKE
mgnify:CR=1 FL=1